MARQQKDETFDFQMRLKDAGSIAASAAAQVGGVDKIIDMGVGRYDARAVVDITAVDATTGDEQCLICIQGSNSSTFASGAFNLGVIAVGDSTKTGETVDTAVASRREIAFCNEVNGVLYQYLRAYTLALGTTPSVNYVANVFKKA